MDSPEKDHEIEPSKQNKTNVAAAQIEIGDLIYECEPCQVSGKNAIEAQFYCKVCDEKYCEVCSISHKTHRATKGHAVVNLADFLKSAMQCDPCQYQKRSSKAAFGCKECEEFLCEDCKIAHLSQRLFKNHQVISIVENLFCQPCEGNDKKVLATGFCDDCEEPELFCIVCSDQHTAMKRTRDHRIQTDLAIYMLKYASNKIEEAVTPSSATETDSFQICCDPCEVDGTNSTAEYYCENCEENMCSVCLEFHDAQQEHKDHTVSPVDKGTVICMCTICSSLKRETPASCYCTDCDDQKLLCNDCAKKHLSMKRTKNHKVSYDMNALRKRYASNEKDSMGTNSSVNGVDICCEPCEADRKQNKAVFYCKDCEENMCSACLEFHDAQQENKAHGISKIAKQTVTHMCIICTSLKRENPASCYCTECDDQKPLCNDCANKHQNMKKTKNHKISTDMGSFRKRITSMEANDLSLSRKDEKLFEKAISTTTEDENTLKGAISTTTKDENPLKEATLTASQDEKAFIEAPVVTKDITDDLEKPYMSEHKSDEIVLQWSSTKQLKDTEVYSIMYKEHPGGRWKNYTTKDPCTQPKATIFGLKPNTPYVFKVRVLDESTGKEGSYTHESDPITTKTSPAVHLLENCEKIEVGPPSVFRLPIRENVMARNEKAKTRKFTLGNSRNITEKERTIMIVGATGCGKSTLINGMANYIMGVTWEDPFRFTLINLETCEQERAGNEALSQTEWVTCYTIYTTVSDRIDYIINLIDTPGFGDTRGLHQDEIIVDQIRQLFTAKGVKGVATLDAVCFILKAPDARLTATQRYIFESILALFGNDIKDNICTLITFADGQRPPVLSGIQAIDGVPLPYETYFTFNNSAIFVDNSHKSENNLSSFFWDMGIRSCKTFFDHVKKLKTRSLSLTSEVLIKRETLGNTIRNLQQEIEVGLSQINILEKEIKLFTENAAAILANQDFEYTVDEQYQEKIDLTGKGQYTTNCLQCNYTCHESCAFPNDNDKARCCAMNSEGKCNECPQSCHWTNHHNTPYIIKWSKKKVKKRYDDMKKKYEDATKKSLSQEQVLEQMDKDVTQIETHVQVMMEEITALNNRLKEIALRPDPLSTVQYIDLMIQSEKREMKSGFEERIESLEKCKTRAQYGEHVQIFKDRIHSTRQSILPMPDKNKAEEKSLVLKVKKQLWKLVSNK